MGWQALLFSFEGRINRKPFWLVPLAAFLFVLVWFAVYASVAILLNQLNAAEYSVLPLSLLSLGALVACVAFIVAGIALGVKRLHDRDKSGHWLWLFYVMPGLLNAAGSSSGPGPFNFILSIVVFAIWIWALVELGFLRGTTGPNQYGPDPLEAINRNDPLTLPKG